MAIVFSLGIEDQLPPPPPLPPAGRGGVGVLGISSDREDRMGTKIKTQKDPYGLLTKPKRIPGPKILTPKESHAEFLTLKISRKGYMM